jgi:lipopolysaccharide transport system ATP-binding protein
MNNDIILSVENISKQYQLGVFGSGTIGGDVQRWWYKIRGKEDPFLKIGETNERSVKSDSKFVWALQDINFEVKRGEVLGIIGKNGAGKSTLLKLLSRVTGPTTGIIRSGGRMASLLEVGTGFHPELTGLENIYLNGAILGMTKAEIKRKLDEIIDFSGVARYIDTPVKRYSTGMKVRLGFAVAAFLEPEILVVDEVLAVGDAEFQKKAIGKMKEVSEGGGRTVLFVSHNMASIQNLCTRGIILSEGKLIFDNNVESAISKYLLQSQKFMIKNLAERNDRRGNGLLRFTNINFKDALTGKNLEMIRSGQNIVIEFSYETNLSIDTNILIGIGFFTQQGSFLFACKNDSIGAVLKVNRQRRAICRIDTFPLNQGVYNYNIIAYYNNETTDHLNDAGEINVESGDFYGTGKLPATSKPGVLISFKWE